MYLLNVSLSKYKCINCCSVRMGVCPIRFCVVFLLWTASVGDALRCCIFVCNTCHLSMSAHAWGLMHSKCPRRRTRCWKGACPSGHLRPVETAAWQRHTHLGFFQCGGSCNLSCSSTHSVICVSCVFTVIHKCTIKLLFMYCVHLFVCWVCLRYFASNEAIKLKSLLLSQCVYNLPSIYSCTASQPLSLCRFA